MVVSTCQGNTPWSQKMKYTFPFCFGHRSLFFCGQLWSLKKQNPKLGVLAEPAMCFYLSNCLSNYIIYLWMVQSHTKIWKKLGIPVISVLYGSMLMPTIDVSTPPDCKDVWQLSRFEGEECSRKPQLQKLWGWCLLAPHLHRPADLHANARWEVTLVCTGGMVHPNSMLWLDAQCLPRRWKRPSGQWYLVVHTSRNVWWIQPGWHGWLAWPNSNGHPGLVQAIKVFGTYWQFSLYLNPKPTTSNHPK